MRACHWGLPLLTLAAVLAATPAHAADEASAGVVDDVVVVRARESVPGERGGSDSSCTYEVVIEDDRAFGVYEVDGVRQFSDTGRWLRKKCDGEVVDIGGLFVFPEGGGFETPDVLAQAVEALDPIAPTWDASPDGIAVAMVTQMPVSLWIEPGYWNGNFVVRAESPSGRVWAEAQAVPTTTTWNTGDGGSVSCAGPGSGPESLDPGSCSHTYEHSTAGTAGVAVTATVTFAVVGTTSDDLTPRVVGQLSRTSLPVLVTVGEIQAIETNGQ